MQEREPRLWPLWLGSLITVSAFSAYMANPQAVKTRVGAARAAYRAAVSPPAASVSEHEELRDALGAAALGVTAARLPPRPLPPPRRPARKAVSRPRPVVQPRPVSPDSEEEFLRLYQVAPLPVLDKGKTFLVEGTVFNLDSGAFLDKASLYFRDPNTKKAFVVRTNDWGEYALRLPRNIDGYRLAIYREGFRPQYLRDWSPSMKETNPHIRKQVAAELLSLPFEGLMVFHRPREDQLLDFALLPR